MGNTRKHEALLKALKAADFLFGEDTPLSRQPIAEKLSKRLEDERRMGEQGMEALALEAAAAIFNRIDNSDGEFHATSPDGPGYCGDCGDWPATRSTPPCVYHELIRALAIYSTPSVADAANSGL